MMEDLIPPIVANLTVRFGLLLREKYKKIIKGSESDFDKELKRIIHSSITEYGSLYPESRQDKIPFYKSETFLTELLKFRFSQEFNPNVLINEVKRDERIIPPAEHELKKFLEILDSNIELSTQFKKLGIEENYKEEIYKISDLLKTGLDQISRKIDDTKEELKNEFSNAKVNSILREEWSRQVDEITDNLKSFKPFRAKDSLDVLEGRIIKNGGFEDKNLKAKFVYLKGLCSQETNASDYEKENSELFVQAWKLNPNNFAYKVSAALGFYVLEDFDKSVNLANEILAESSYDNNAWALKCFLSEKPKDFLITEVPTAVKEKPVFKVQVGYWLFTQKLIMRISELDDLGLSIDFGSIEVPKEINFDNKNYWIQTAQNCLIRFSEQNAGHPLFGINQKAGKDHLFNLTNKLLERIVAAFKGSELEKKYSHLSFQYHYTNFQIAQKDASIRGMESAFAEIEKKSPIHVFQLGQVISSSLNPEKSRKVIQLIDDFGEQEHELLAYTKSVLHHLSDESIASWDSFKIFLGLLSKINYQYYGKNLSGNSAKLN